MEVKQELGLVSIGTIKESENGKIVSVEGEYAAGLKELSGFGHVIVVWWANLYEEYRFEVGMAMELPYAAGIHAGLFATRSPVRPNPICISTCKIHTVDVSSGTIGVDEIDAVAGTPVLDIKPYYGILDRVEAYIQPNWVPGEWSVWRMPVPVEDYASEQ